MKTRVVRAPKKGKVCPRAMRNLSEALADADGAPQICGFLLGILTPPEVARIGLRWELVKLLQRGGFSQRRIGKILGVSLCKTTRGSRELKKGPAGFSQIVKIGLAKESKRRV